MSNLVTDARDECATEITMALINRIPDVHAIYADAIKREVLRELSKSRLLSERERLLAIVRGLTELEYPFTDGGWCKFGCGAEEGLQHAPDCPYRLATEYMAEVTK